MLLHTTSFWQNEVVCRLMDVSCCAILLVLVICWIAYWNVTAWQNVRDDKEKAEKRIYRTPEKDLLKDAWLGGIGGYLALLYFHHKTRTAKEDFKNEYCRRTTCCVIGHILVAVIVALLAVCGGLEMACELLHSNISHLASVK